MRRWTRWARRSLDCGRVQLVDFDGADAADAAAGVEADELGRADAERRRDAGGGVGAGGRLSGFRPGAISAGAWFALAYLIVFGSIIGFTAYIWLLHHESPTKVGTYA